MICWVGVGVLVLVWIVYGRLNLFGAGAVGHLLGGGGAGVVNVWEAELGWCRCSFRNGW